MFFKTKMFATKAYLGTSRGSLSSLDGKIIRIATTSLWKCAGATDFASAVRTLA
jgi:hypothetical protein